MLTLTKPGFGPTLLRPFANFMARFNPRMRQTLAEFDDSLAYAHTIDCVVYLRDRGVLSAPDVIRALERIKTSQ